MLNIERGTKVKQKYNLHVYEAFQVIELTADNAVVFVCIYF